MRPGRGARAFWFAMSASLIATMNRTEDIADFPEKERDSYEALQGIHSLMDDDRDGSVDRQESHEFLREDLQCSDPSARHSSFHREDSAVSFAEMWDAWRASEGDSSFGHTIPPSYRHTSSFPLCWFGKLYKWTSDDVLRWVEETVELPQYLELFRDHNISGPHLPQLAASNQTLLTGLLHITDRSHRHKLQLKALDVVLFGPPPATHSPVKDAILVAAVVAGLGAGWVAFLQSKRWRRHVRRMELELESLQQAEESLIELQNKLTQAEEEQRNVESEKRSLESRLRTRFERMRAAGGGSENKELGADADEKYKGGECGADQLRASLHRAEKELAMLRESSITTPALRPWLQLTYELEEEQGVLQRKLAEQRLFSARELADRIRRKQHSMLGSFFVAHSVSLDLVDNQILETKQCLAELMSCLRERATRWQEIERLCGFSITQNPGKTALRSMLYDNDESNLHFFSPSSFLAEPQLEAVEHEERGFSLSFPTSTQQYTTTTGDLHATRDSGRCLAGDAGWEYQSSDSCDSIGTMVTDTSACDGGGGSEMSESPKKHDRGLRFTNKSDGKSTERLIQSASDFPRLKTGRLSPLYVRSTRSLQNITSCQDFSQKDAAFVASTTTQSEEEMPFEESDTTEVDIVQCDSSESLKTRDGSAAGFMAKREPGHKFARKEGMRGQKSKLARMFKTKYFKSAN